MSPSGLAPKTSDPDASAPIAAPVEPVMPKKTALHRGILTAGWTLILLLCLVFSDALLLNTLQKEIRQSTLATASMVASNLSAKISTGVRLGKKPATFRGLERLVADTDASFPENGGISILLPDGRPVYLLGEAPNSFAGEEVDKNNVIVRESKNYLDVATPILNRQSAIAGYAVVRVPRNNLQSSLTPLIAGQLKAQASVVGVAFLLLIVLLNTINMTDGEGKIRRKRLYAVCLGSFFLVMSVNVCLALYTYNAQYQETSRANARRMGNLVSLDLNRPLLVGVSTGQVDNVEHYLRKVSGTLDYATVLEIHDDHGHRTVGSPPEHTPVVAGMEQIIRLQGGAGSTLSSAATAQEFQASPTTNECSIVVDVSHEAYTKALLSTVLDALTLVVIALIFMVEMFLLFFQYQDAKLLGLTRRTLNHAQRSGLLRPIMFFFILAMDMSISFIPLRMSELVVGTSWLSLSRDDVLMGLPVSVEMGMTGISVLLAGAWMKRRGIVPPMSTGMTLMMLGYIGSMLSASPAQFILARGLVGLGYGQCILSAEAYTVKDGKLPDMFAGVYAGSLCGSALGAILAERVGCSFVFMVSAVLFACLIALPALLLSEKKEQSGKAPTSSNNRMDCPTAKTDAPTTKRFNLNQIRRLLGNRLFLSLVFLSLMPSALLSVGFLNYFLPVFLDSVDVSQSNIGRVFMLYCLILIYGGPPVGDIVYKSPRKALMIFWGGVAGALAMLSFTVLPPLPAALLGAVLLGVATCFNVPSQSAYLLQLDIAQAIGIDLTMGLLNAMTRVGQVLGPLCTGAFVAAQGVTNAALWTGFSYIGISILFLMLADRSMPVVEQTS